MYFNYVQTLEEVVGPKPVLKSVNNQESIYIYVTSNGRLKAVWTELNTFRLSFLIWPCSGSVIDWLFLVGFLGLDIVQIIVWAVIHFKQWSQNLYTYYFNKSSSFSLKKLLYKKIPCEIFQWNCENL